MDPEFLSGRRRLAAHFLAGCMGPKGRFRYRSWPDASVGTDDRYNVLRHAGALWALGRYGNLIQDAPVIEAYRRGWQWLVENAVAPVASIPLSDAVWSRNEVEGHRKPIQAKLGGTALGLLALLEGRIWFGDREFAEVSRRLGRFLVAMQLPSGKFWSKYVPQDGGPSNRWESLYYPGEAAFALVRLFDCDGDPYWLRAAVRGLCWLAIQRRELALVPSDHWALLATAEVWKFRERFEEHGTAEILLEHARQICQSILAERELAMAIDEPGCFTGDGRTCPTATRLEGLLAAQRLDEATASTPMVEAAVASGIDFLLRAQILSGPLTGGVPRSISELGLDHPRYQASLNRRASEVRIDYVQHALCAWLDYQPPTPGDSSADHLGLTGIKPTNPEF